MPHTPADANRPEGPWFVILRQGAGHDVLYGPMGNEYEAAKFAEYLRTEVDPAYVVTACSPTWELLAWRTQHLFESHQDH
jgi:hypothetical protein